MDTKKLTVVVAGSVTTQSGYGSHSRDIARALIMSGKYNVKVVSMRWGMTPQDALNPADPKDKMILDRIVPTNLTDQPDIFIHITIPNEFQRIGKYNIGLTAGIETTQCRADWIEGCNRMDLVLGTSEHSVKVFRTSKFEQRDKKTQELVNILELERPSEVLFEGVDTEIYKGRINTNSEITKTLKAIPEDFCFLFVGHWLQGDLGQDRKDVGMLIRVFLETFKRTVTRKMPALILKTSQAAFSEIEKAQILAKINDIRAMVRAGGWTKRLPNIYVVYGNLSDDEMNDLYNTDKVKAMVSFTKGEGYGRPLLEFTTTGKPIIASAWSGQVDFLNPDHSILLEGKLDNVHPSAANDWIMKESKWFTVNYGVASQAMVNVHKNYDRYLTKCAPHRKYTLERYTLDDMTHVLCDYIDNIESYASQKVTKTPLPQKNAINLPKLTSSKSGGTPPKKLSLPKLKKVIS